METAKSVREPENRDITAQEATLICWLVEHGEPGCDRLLDQIKDLKVVSKCTCGCPTIDFALQDDGNLPRRERLVSDWLAKMGDELFGVMLFEVGGQIRTLEVYCCSGRVKNFGLPETGMLLGYDERVVDRLAPPSS